MNHKILGCDNGCDVINLQNHGRKKNFASWFKSFCSRLFSIHNTVDLSAWWPKVVITIFAITLITQPHIWVHLAVLHIDNVVMS